MNNQTFSDVTPSNQRPREKKSALYAHPGYETLLATKGRYMNILDLGVTDTRPIAELCLIQSNRSIKTQYLAMVYLKRFAKGVHTKNEAKVVRDISLLICVSAELLALYDNIEFKLLIDSFNKD